MKFPRLLLSALSLTLGCVLLPAQATTAASAPAKVLPVARVAWVNTNAFVAEEGGIKQLVRNIKELELEFSGAESELNLQSEKLRTLVSELQKLQAGGEANAQAIQEKQAEGIKLQRELQAKQQQAQAAFGQAQQEKQGPIFAEIGKALTAFAKEREIGFILDVAKLGDGVLVAQPELEVTNDFIAYFNASHP
ncbi:MAG TPA: OmpH family outer membrane protein [Lacunisphaera sp.]|nr:OmpH family outer membrane protein [Lacunisphaera sp.]